MPYHEYQHSIFDKSLRYLAATWHGRTVPHRFQAGLVTEVHRMTAAERQEVVELVGACIA